MTASGERALRWAALVPRLQLVAAAALFSTGGAAIKATTLTGWQVASFRSGVAAVTVLLLVPAARRLPDWRALLVGAGYGATMILFVVSNKLTTAASSIFLQSTAPVYILLASPWVLREPVRRADVAFMAVMGLGLLPFFLGSDLASATAPDPERGNMVALASGVTWAITLMGMRWLAARAPGSSSAVSTVVVGNVVAFLGCLPLAMPVVAATPGDWLAVGYLGVFQIGVAYLCLTAGLGRVPALEASTILLVEPALNPVWAWAVHGERPGAGALVGGAVILTATGVRSWWDARAARGSAPAPEPAGAGRPDAGAAA